MDTQSNFDQIWLDQIRKGKYHSMIACQCRWLMQNENDPHASNSRDSLYNSCMWPLIGKFEKKCPDDTCVSKVSLVALYMSNLWGDGFDWSKNWATGGIIVHGPVIESHIIILPCILLNYNALDYPLTIYPLIWTLLIESIIPVMKATNNDNQTLIT